MRWWLVVVAIGLALAAAFAVSRGRSDVPPVGPGSGAARVESGPAATLRTDRTELGSGDARAGGTVAPAIGEDGGDPESEASSAEGDASGALTVVVVDRGGSPVDAFRFTFAAGADRRTGQVSGAEVVWPLPLGVEASFVIEAEGFEPSGEQRATLTAAEPARTLRVFLERAHARSGVELWVTGPDGAPAQWLEVEAFAVDGDGVAVPPPLWRRQAHQTSGVYELPELRPGRYTLRLRGLDEAGAPVLAQPFEAAVEVTGSGRVTRAVQLAPGGQLDLTVVDGAGTARGADVLARLVPAGAAPLRTRWVGRGADGALLERAGALPVAGAVWLADAIAPGAYTLQLQVGTGDLVERAVTLVAGQRVGVHVVLP